MYGRPEPERILVRLLVRYRARNHVLCALELYRRVLAVTPFIRMAAERGESGGPPPSTTKNLGSYYRRPSAAIEKGGGFFVPGLEGFRCSELFTGPGGPPNLFSRASQDSEKRFGTVVFSPRHVV